MPARTRKLTALVATLVGVWLATPTVASASCAGADLIPSAGSLAQLEAATFCLLNEQRRANGLAALASNGPLSTASRLHSADMVANRYFEHVSLSGRAPRQRMEAAGYSLQGVSSWTVGENTAWGSGRLGTPAMTVESWMLSPGHRANILKSAFRDIGVGVALGSPRFDLLQAATYTTDFGYRSVSQAERSASPRRRASRCRRATKRKSKRGSRARCARRTSARR